MTPIEQAERDVKMARELLEGAERKLEEAKNPTKSKQIRMVELSHAWNFTFGEDGDHHVTIYKADGKVFIDKARYSETAWSKNNNNYYNYEVKEGSA